MKKLIIIPILALMLFLPLYASADRDCAALCEHVTDDPNTTGVNEFTECKERCENAIIASKEEIIDLIVKVTNWFAAIVFAIAVVMLLYAGFLYITAGGSEDKAGTARKLITYALIGIAVAILAFGAQAIVSSFLTIKNP